MLGNSTVIGMCVQVAFILAGNTFVGYNKLLKNALGIEAVDSNAYMDTICSTKPQSGCSVTGLYQRMRGEKPVLRG